MAAMHYYFLTHPSPLKHHVGLPHLPLHKLSPSTCHRLFSVISKPATVTQSSRNVQVVNCLPRVHHHADEDQGDQLPPGRQKESMPSHVAVIIDGNWRWARSRGLPIALGYEAGARAFTRVVNLCCKWRIRVLTIFIISPDNLINRSTMETDMIMEVFEKRLRNDLPHFMRKKVRISHIGDSTKLPKSFQLLLSEAAETTKNNSQLHLILAINYSGQNDLVQACQRLALKVKDGLIEPEDINKSLLERELETKCTEFPSPDLLIRVSGELRISNFLLWQLAFTELYFANSPWPDFGEDEFVKALSSFQQRRRRFGGRKP